MTLRLRLRFWRALRRFALARVIASGEAECAMSYWSGRLFEFATERLGDAKEEEPVVRDLTP